MQNDLKKIIEHYGKDSQVLMAIEEMSELTKELCKDHRDTTHNKNNIIEEMADVEVMLDQLRIIFEIDEEIIQKVKKQKVKRTIERFEI